MTMLTGIKDYPLRRPSELGAKRERGTERGGVILFNGTVSCKYYRTLMKDGCSMCMEHWWRFTGREKSKYI